jgi:hypothetical protein
MEKSRKLKPAESVSNGSNEVHFPRLPQVKSLVRTEYERIINEYEHTRPNHPGKRMTCGKIRNLFMRILAFIFKPVRVPMQLYWRFIGSHTEPKNEVLCVIQ